MQGGKPWISEMYGYSFACAKCNVWHTWDTNVMHYPTYVPSGVNGNTSAGFKSLEVDHPSDGIYTLMHKLYRYVIRSFRLKTLLCLCQAQFLFFMQGPQTLFIMGFYLKLSTTSLINIGMKIYRGHEIHEK